MCVIKPSPNLDFRKLGHSEYWVKYTENAITFTARYRNISVHCNDADLIVACVCEVGGGGGVGGVT